MKSKIINFIVIIGIIVFFIGVYSMFFKAGVPYIDPTPEMTRNWMFYYNVGKLTMPAGAVLVIIGIVFKILIKLNKK
ncbi:MAG: hypothetical protein IJD97_08635 [Clostridia bacterium]|nr:hypothetical protein [Clostridia bacterium]